MNFLIVKFPPKLKIGENQKIAGFSFDTENDFQRWFLVDEGKLQKKRVVWDKDVGYQEKGSLHIEGGYRRMPVASGTSPLVPVESGKIYKVEAWIKAGQLLEKSNRDGFIRVDFYQDDPGDINLKTRSLYSTVSSRLFGTSDWVKREILIVAPSGAKFMTVGMQISNYSDFWLDSVLVYQSTNRVDDIRLPNIDYRIPDDILFPYSQGGL